MGAWDQLHGTHSGNTRDTLGVHKCNPDDPISGNLVALSQGMTQVGPTKMYPRGCTQVLSSEVAICQMKTPER